MLLFINTIPDFFANCKFLYVIICNTFYDPLKVADQRFIEYNIIIIECKERNV